MFSHLLASQPVRQRSTGGLAVSIALHLTAATGVVYATTKTVEVIQKDPPAALVYVDPAPTPPQPVVRLEQPTNAVPSVLPAIPREIPITLPPLVSPIIAAVERSLIPGSSFAPPLRTQPTGLPSQLPGSVYRQEQVEVPVSLLKTSPVPRYPPALTATGLDGFARFRFVVDSAGRVEMPSVEQLQASHGAFAQAVLSTLPRMRFTPARVDGHAVRQLVELPFEFRTRK